MLLNTVSILIVYPVLLGPCLLLSHLCLCGLGAADVLFSLRLEAEVSVSHGDDYKDLPAIRQSLSLAWNSIRLDCLAGRHQGSSSSVSPAPALKAGTITHGVGSGDRTHFTD